MNTIPTTECQTLDVKSSAVELGVCEETIRRLVRRKVLRKLPGLRRVLIPRTEIHRYLNGGKAWSATINELAPKPVALAEIDSVSATLGEFLAEVERTANLKPRTFRYYGSCLRQLAAYVQGSKSDASRFDYRKGGFKAWRQQVDTTPLSALTPAAAADYKMLRLKRAGNDPRRKLEVNRSFNSWLRCAKSLFSDAIICKPNFRVKVPKFKVPDGQRGECEVYWFETVTFERPGSMKFQAPVGITYEALVTNARQELRAASPRPTSCSCFAFAPAFAGARRMFASGRN